MKKAAIIVAGIAMIMLLASCSVRPSEITESQMQSFMETVSYGQDQRTGLCFALIATKKRAEVTQNSIGFTQVPCTDEVLALIN